MEKISQTPDAFQNAAPPEGVELPELDDPLVIKDLLRAHAMAVSKRLAEAAHKNVRKEEVIEADRRAAAFLAATLSGLNPAYRKAKVNTPEGIESRLRKALQSEIEKSGFSGEELKDSKAFMQLAMFVFTNRIHDLITWLTSNADAIETEGPKRLEALLEEWVGKITKDRLDG